MAGGMATTTSTNATPTDSGSPSSSCTLSAVSCGTPSPGTLYLFTFLATLLLLGIVAGGIVSRSVYLRRRQQQLIASGQWPPPAAPRVKPQVNLSQRPRIFEAKLNAVVPPSELGHWEVIVPLSAVYEPPPAPLESFDPDAVLNNELSFPPTTRAGIFGRRRRVLEPPIISSPPPEFEIIPLITRHPNYARTSHISSRCRLRRQSLRKKERTVTREGCPYWNSGSRR
ncbi:hypothetical protein FB451DRAFT_696080 [Mycena latifolia]|nr:hypothetical protein FB451DRAFT_696080 [Mycena latifolia]